MYRSSRTLYWVSSAAHDNLQYASFLQFSCALTQDCSATLAKPGYEKTLSDLIKLTFNNVYEHVAQDASVLSAMAQKVDPNVKITASIK